MAKSHLGYSVEIPFDAFVFPDSVFSFFVQCHFDEIER